VLFFLLRKPVGWLIDAVVLVLLVLYIWNVAATHSFNPASPAQIGYCGLTFKRDKDIPPLSKKAAEQAAGGSIDTVKRTPIGLPVDGHEPKARAGEVSCAGLLFAHLPGGKYKEYSPPGR
jgi:hypothetical protein